MTERLTNDDFLAGVRCLRLLWYRRHQPHRDEPSLYRAYQQDQTRRLLAVAGAAAADEERAGRPWQSPTAPASREVELGAGVTARARADGWVDGPDGPGIELLRPVTSLKDSVLWDAAFVCYVFEQAEGTVAAVNVGYLDKGYRHNGNASYEGLITTVDLTRRVRGRAAQVRERLGRMAEALRFSEEELERKVARCTRRHCPVCASRAGHVERLASRETEGELSPHDRIQLGALRSGRPHIDYEAVRSFLEGLEYPLYFLDFEAFSEAVPSLAGVAPWEHVPVIYSLERIDAPGEESTHAVYAADPKADGRRALFADLSSRLGDSGSIIVYGKGFERRMLERLVSAPGVAAGYRGLFENIVSRLADLSSLFARYHFYHPRQQGSASLKAVYRALTGGDYAELDVADGRAANVFYYFLRHGFPDGHDVPGGGGSARTGVLENLKHYCSLDTTAMIRILEHVSAVVRDKEGQRPDTPDSE